MSEAIKVVADGDNIREVVRGMAKGDRQAVVFHHALGGAEGAVRKLKVMHEDRYDVSVGRVSFVCHGEDDAVRLIGELANGEDVVARYIP